MSSTTPNLGLTKTTAAETIGQNWAASNDSGGNFDIIDTKMGAVGNTSLQAQVTALNSNLTTKIPSTAKICVDYTNGTQFTFPVTKANAGAYSYFLLVGGSSSSSGFVYHGFIHVAGNYATWLTLIGGTAVSGIAASYDGTNLVITVTNTQYGGMRLIWLG